MTSGFHIFKYEMPSAWFSKSQTRTSDSEIQIKYIFHMKLVYNN